MAMQENEASGQKRKLNLDVSGVRKRRRPNAADKERERLRLFNQALHTLQSVLPIRLTENRKFYKKQTLQLAIRYIHFLRGCLTGRRQWGERSRFWCRTEDEQTMNAVDDAVKREKESKPGSRSGKVVYGDANAGRTFVCSTSSMARLEQPWKMPEPTMVREAPLRSNFVDGGLVKNEVVENDGSISHHRCAESLCLCQCSAHSGFVSQTVSNFNSSTFLARETEIGQSSNEFYQRSVSAWPMASVSDGQHTAPFRKIIPRAGGVNDVCTKAVQNVHFSDWRFLS